jgi:hypothetical protein
MNSGPMGPDRWNIDSGDKAVQMQVAEQRFFQQARRTVCANRRWGARRWGIAVLASVPVALLSMGALAQPTLASQAKGRAAASETYVKEEGHLRLDRKSGGSAIVEQGAASGTFDASVQAEITIKISEVAGSVVIYLKGGSISGYASATPHFSGKYVSFKGSLTIKHGTGRYRGASGTAGFYGVLNHANYTLSVQLIGHLHM